ncbi:MAG: hypothetical protein WC313_03835 [Candidatus Kapaibacterium sp.]|jgi:hypothetical protein|nr:hypothetical protein [Candidatus Kapabacteria bacterium]
MKCFFIETYNQDGFKTSLEDLITDGTILMIMMTNGHSLHKTK